MAAGTVGFFEPTSPISIDSSWTFQNGGGSAASLTRESELGSSGDEILSALHDKKSSISLVFVHGGSGTYYVLPKVGTVSNGWHIDSFSVAWDRAQLAAKLTVNCHKHMTGTGHASGSCRTYTPSLSQIPVAAFGVPNAFTGGTDKDAFSLAATAAVDLRSATYTVSCQHADELARNGNHLIGNNYDGSETLAVELTGAATSDDYTTDWDQTTDGSTPANTGVTTSSFNFENHLTADTASA